MFCPLFKTLNRVFSFRIIAHQLRMLCAFCVNYLGANKRNKQKTLFTLCCIFPPSSQQTARTFEQQQQLTTKEPSSRIGGKRCVPIKQANLFHILPASRSIPATRGIVSPFFFFALIFIPPRSQLADQGELSIH